MSIQPYDKYKESGFEWIGNIPDEWQIKPLKSYLTFQKGKNAGMYTKEYVFDHEGEYPVYSGQTENNGILGLINSYEYDINECLFTTTVGARVMSVLHLKGKFTLSQNCLIMLNKKTEEIHLRYAYYFLQPLFNYEKSLIPTYMQPSLRIEDLKKYHILMPSYKEQVLIANFLDIKCSNIDKIIQSNKEQVGILKKYRESLITEIVTRGLNPHAKMKNSGTEWIGMIPENWDIKRLGFLGSLQNGISKPSDDFGFGYPFVSYGDVYKNIELPKDVAGLVNSSNMDRKVFSVKEGDVFFTRTSETVEEIGISSTCLETIENASFAGFLIRFRQRKNELIPGYSKYYFRSENHRKYFVKEMNLVTRASLNQELLKKLPVLLPPKEEQKKIADFLDDICSNIEKLIKQKQQFIIEMESYKKSLIYEAVTGKINVQNFNKTETEVRA
jgi:type I restriction enzyme, S subunit